MGWYELLFGNLPPQPAHPASRGASFGAGAYQNMPDMTAGIEDRRGEHAMDSPEPPLPAYAANQAVLSRYPPGNHAYDPDQWKWLQAHMPQNPPTSLPPDPDYSPDPSIVAHIRAAQDAKDTAEMGGWGPVTPSTNLPFTPQQMQNALQLWQGQ